VSATDLVVVDGWLDFEGWQFRPRLLQDAHGAGDGLFGAGHEQPMVQQPQLDILQLGKVVERLRHGEPHIDRPLEDRAALAFRETQSLLGGLGRFRREEPAGRGHQAVDQKFGADVFEEGRDLGPIL
jgi:hypothetical protein